MSAKVSFLRAPAGLALMAITVATAAAACRSSAREHAPEREGIESQARTLVRQPGFVEKKIALGLTAPTAVEFAKDGRLYIAEKSGRIKELASVANPTVRVVADLGPQVYDYWDRGLMDIALHPDFPQTPYLYALYTLDGKVGDTQAAGTVPRYRDDCGDPSGVGCVAAGRLVRIELGGTLAAVNASERVLVENWGQQFPSHSVGSLAFGPDGQLYVSAGEGANFQQVDDGSLGGNPLGDPPQAGGSLRAQQVTLPAATPPYPTWFDGKIIRVDPMTTQQWLDPRQLIDPPAVVAVGLRNPFRLAFRPDTQELWIADVGWDRKEEIDRIPNATQASGYLNFGWPCYEGSDRQDAFESGNYPLCRSLYGTPGGHTPPWWDYDHGGEVVPGDDCGTGSSSIGGVAFYPGGNYPADYKDALFFADYARGCIWAMPTGNDGLPDPAQRRVLLSGSNSPVELEIGPGGDVYWVDVHHGELKRLEYTQGNRPPEAALLATPTAGPVPLTVAFDASASTDLDGEALGFDWDLDGNGSFCDASGSTASFVFATAGKFTPRVRVRDSRGGTGEASVVITAGSSAPRPTIDRPLPFAWKVGDVIDFAGRATDAEEGELPPSALTWDLVVHHCPSDCHLHFLKQESGVASGSFVAIDHEYPMHLELRLTARDRDGLVGTTSIALRPKTTTVVVDSQPSGLQVAINEKVATAPFSRTVIVGSSNSLGAPTQSQAGQTHQWQAWADGGPQNRTVIATEGAAPYLARFTTVSLRDVTAAATAIVAAVPEPKGGGNHDLEVIRDGKFPAVGSDDSEEQYDSWHSEEPASSDFIGYTFAAPQTFGQLVFQEGRHFWDGGWWDDVQVEVRQGGVWKAVAGQEVKPSYAGNNDVSYETYTFDFQPIEGDGIRIFGKPGGVAGFISVGELRVLVTDAATATPPPEPTPDPVPTPMPPPGPTSALVDVTNEAPTIIARVLAPLGGGNHDPEVMRDGKFPAPGSDDSEEQYDTWDDEDPAAEDWVGYAFASPLTFGRLVFQEGRHFWDGGFFIDLRVEVRQAGIWVPVTGSTITPAYKGKNGVSYESFTFDFQPTAGDAIRLIGRPGGVAGFISVGELRVLSTP